MIDFTQLNRVFPKILLQIAVALAAASQLAASCSRAHCRDDEQITNADGTKSCPGEQPNTSAPAASSGSSDSPTPMDQPSYDEEQFARDELTGVLGWEWKYCSGEEVYPTGGCLMLTLDDGRNFTLNRISLASNDEFIIEENDQNGEPKVVRIPYDGGGESGSLVIGHAVKLQGLIGSWTSIREVYDVKSVE